MMKLIPLLGGLFMVLLEAAVFVYTVKLLGGWTFLNCLIAYIILIAICKVIQIVQRYCYIRIVTYLINKKLNKGVTE